tara:strand:- start:413 stop:538 length:126 start_codon:yes stop_codon:yes gene_type:complete
MAVGMEVLEIRFQTCLIKIIKKLGVKILAKLLFGIDLLAID